MPILKKNRKDTYQFSIELINIYEHQDMGKVRC